MNQNNKSENSSFFNFLLIILKWKKFILINLLVVLVISTFIAFLLPKIYYSSASVLPPKEEMSILGGSGLGGLTSVMREFSSIKGIGSLGNKNTYNYLVILNSREVAEKVIKKYNLQEIYGYPNSMDKTLKAYYQNVVFEVQEEGNLEIGFYDEDPQRAADIANYLVDLLNERSYELSVTEARSNRKFLEGRVNENMDSLKVAEDQLKDYQEKHGIFTIPEQTGALLEASSKIYAEKIAKEIEIDYLSKMFSNNNEILNSARLQLDAINKKVNDLPSLGIEYLRIYRNILIRTKILEFLRPMLEQAIYQEKKDVPVIVVVDKAKVPEYKAKPKRIIVIGSSVFGWLIITIIIVLSIEKWRNFKLHNNDKYNILKNALK
ncbi:MAG TPA: Wzz/FepE/Etk N-terminal domain-containing protein [Ignavibacteria bacterium]